MLRVELDLPVTDSVDRLLTGKPHRFEWWEAIKSRLAQTPDWGTARQRTSPRSNLMRVFLNQTDWDFPHIKLVYSYDHKKITIHAIEIYSLI